MDIKLLKTEYKKILEKVTDPHYSFTDDKYSGVFLPVNFNEYNSSSPKIMIVGRETAGWNTKNNKNLMKRIVQNNKAGSLDNIIDEATGRYSWHLLDGPKGKLKTKHKSHFKRYYCNVAKEMGISPYSMIYANLFAWDYDNKSPLIRPKDELSKISNLSLQLLATQIKLFNPDYIIFATGRRGIDSLIKQLFEEHFNGYKTEHVIPRKLWEFTSAEKRCFRIAHPRAQHGHSRFRAEVIDKIKKYSL